MGPEEILSRIAARYGWSDEELRGETALPGVRRFAPALPAAPDPPFHSRIAISPEAGHFADHYVGAGNDGRHVIATIAEHRSATEARTHLAMVLDNCMAILPNCRERGLDIGEICYCGLGDPPLSVLFVRRNVFVEVASVGPIPAAAAGIAATIDQQIMDHIAAQEGTNDADAV